MTPCKPSLKHDICALCQRYAPQLPDDPEERPHTLLMDASIVSELESCGMFEAKPIPVQWWNREAEFA